MSKKVEFFWDVASPYTYLASTQLEDLGRRTGAEIVYRPFLLGGVFKATGNAAPALVQAKGMYMAKDLARWRRHYDVPMKMPVQEVTFPIVSVLPMRVATAADSKGQGKAFCHAVMRAYWEQAKDVSEQGVLREVIAEVGLDPDAVLEAATSPEVKDRLREISDEAVSRGAFGAPTFFVGDAMYFGNDRMHFLERALTR